MSRTGPRLSLKESGVIEGVTFYSRFTRRPKGSERPTWVVRVKTEEVGLVTPLTVPT